MLDRSLLRLAAGALSLALAAPACAQKPAPAQDADPALWVVKDRDTTIYLFGTVHVLKPGLSWFDEAVKAAFDRSDTLVLEIVQPDAPAMQRLVAARGMTAAGPGLTAQLPEKERAPFAAAMAQTGLPRAAYDRFKPWLAAVTLSVAPLTKLGYDPANAPEQVLTAAARAGGKKVDALETAEQQLGYFDALSHPAQLTLLISTVDELPTAGRTMAEMVGDWSRGDETALAALLNDQLKDSAEVDRVLLTDRNKRWAAWIADRMTRPGVVFVAVGAGHLAGPDGVQAQLAAYRLKAKRVKY